MGHLLRQPWCTEARINPGRALPESARIGVLAVGKGLSHILWTDPGPFGQIGDRPRHALESAGRPRGKPPAVYRLPQKLFFCVCRRSDRAEDGALPLRKFPRKLCRGGKSRNNFCIVVADDDGGGAGGGGTQKN